MQFVKPKNEPYMCLLVFLIQFLSNIKKFSLLAAFMAHINKIFVAKSVSNLGTSYIEGAKAVLRIGNVYIQYSTRH